MRCCTTLALDRLAPRSLGAPLALYEHRVFTSGTVRGINSFDQWGSSSAALGARILQLLEPGSEGVVPAEIGASTAGLLGQLRA